MAGNHLKKFPVKRGKEYWSIWNYVLQKHNLSTVSNHLKNIFVLVLLPNNIYYYNLYNFFFTDCNKLAVCTNIGRYYAGNIWSTLSMLMSHIRYTMGNCFCINRKEYIEGALVTTRYF